MNKLSRSDTIARLLADGGKKTRGGANDNSCCIPNKYRIRSQLKTAIEDTGLDLRAQIIIAHSFKRLAKGGSAVLY
jgi:hypothetical protein